VITPPLAIPETCCSETGATGTFEEVGKAWGFDSTQISHGIVLADLDNDGDLDVIVSCLLGAAADLPQRLDRSARGRAAQGQIA